MPPKPKFTREEMVEAALELVARRGAEALTARELGAALGSSARPIFTVFRGMDELQQAVREAAMRRFEQFVRQPVANMPVFKQVGLQMVRFAMQEPKLYQLLFMQENADTAGFEDMFRALGGTAEICMEAIRRDYGLTPEEARAYMAEGQFAPGSMLPKVEAAVEFAESAPGRSALITLLEKAKDGVAGKTGTAIHQ